MELKHKIVEGASNLFLQYGVRSVTMDEVAREVGMSKKTLYQSFANKGEIVLEVGKAHIEHEKSEFGNIHDNCKDAIDELHQLTSCVSRCMENMNPSLLFDLKKYHPDAWQLFLAFRTEFIQSQVRENIERGIEEGYYRPELNADLLAKIRMEQVQVVFDPKIFPSNTYNLVELQLAVLDHFIHGLLSDKGRQLYKDYQTSLYQ